MDSTVRKKDRRLERAIQEARTEAVRRRDKSSLHIQFEGFYLTRGHYSNNSSAIVHDAKPGKIIPYSHSFLTPNNERKLPPQPGQQCLGTRPLNLVITSGAAKKELLPSRDNCNCWILKQFERTSYFLGIQAWVLRQN